MGIIGTVEEYKSPSSITLNNSSVTYSIESYTNDLADGKRYCYLYISNSTYQGKQSKIITRISPLNLTDWNYINVNISSSNASSNTSYKVYVGVSNNPNLTSFSFNSSYTNSFTGNISTITPMINVSSLSGTYYLFFGAETIYGNHTNNISVYFSGMQLTTQ